MLVTSKNVVLHGMKHVMAKFDFEIKLCSGHDTHLQRLIQNVDHYALQNKVCDYFAR